MGHTREEIINALNVIKDTCDDYEGNCYRCPCGDRDGVCHVMDLCPCNWGITGVVDIWRAME